MKAALALVAFVVMLPARWAMAQTVSSPAPSGAPPLAVEPLPKGAAFYDAVDRPDLAAIYRSRHRWAIASRVVGGISLGLGAIVWEAAQVAEAEANPLCQTNCGSHRMWVPYTMMAAGAALLVLPVFWSNDPVSDEEKARLAREAGRTMGFNFAAAPAADGRGGTLVLGGRF
jgi:hypothetical protein